MAGSIADVLGRFKRDPLGVLSRSRIEALCAEVGYDDWRDRTLDPATTIALFVQQVIHGNCSCAEVCHLAGGGGARFTPAAYCQARARLPLRLLQTLLTEVCDVALPLTRQAERLWRGGPHRTWLIDGSTFSMPDTPALQKAFGTIVGQQHQPGCTFPIAHLLLLFHLGTGLLLDVVAAPMYTGDLTDAAALHPHLDAGDILIGDDAFGTYAHLALLLAANLHGLFPVHHTRIIDFTSGRAHTSTGGGQAAEAGKPRSQWIQRLGHDDQLVRWLKPKDAPAWMSQQQYDALPASILVRETRRTACRNGRGSVVVLTMVTTLLDPIAYPAEALLELRLARWMVETDIGHLKTTMKMDVLHCKTEAGVRKELAVFCVVYNLVRVVMLEAARRQEVEPSRISFADALHWMRHARPGDVMPALIVNPHRPNRAEPRCTKRRPKAYKLMNRPRDVLRKGLKNQRKRA